MCGIVGVVGNNNSVRIAIDALKRLEYRGYDSFGVSVLHDQEIFTKKSVGSAIEKDNQGFFVDVPPAPLVIAHTRWATHGRVTEKNAHPHHSYDGNFSLVHNGVIENYLEIRQQLLEQGVQCKTETDTEVIAHLLAKHYEVSGDLLKTIYHTIGELEGEYAFVFLTRHDPDHIYAARYKSPLVFGSTPDLTIIASDQTAIAPLTKNMTFIREGDVVKASFNKAVCYEQADGRLVEVQRESVHIPWVDEALGRHGHPHYMIKEIYETPTAVETALKLRRVDLEPIVNDLVKRQLSITGAGSAFYASQIGQYYFADLANKYTYVHPSDEFLNLFKISNNDHLITISQSGETFDTLEVTRRAIQVGAPVTSISNMFGSTSHRLATYPIFQGAGAEVCVLTTKAIVSQAIILFILATLLGKKNGTLTSSQAEGLLDDAHRLPEAMGMIFEKYQPKIKETAIKHKDITNWFFIGRWMYYPVAMESALKYKEVSYLHAEGMPAGFFKHGTISLIDDDFYTIAFLPKEESYPDIFHFTISNISEIQARGGKVIAFGHEEEGHKDIKSLYDYIQLPTVNKYLDPILHLTAGQLLAYHCAIALGREIDKPRALAKSVTVR
ncbi:MAG: glutamine--fructose-6-phosphate transaminase (isomerizing) [Gammaproteobacteria bacterium]|nr:glutamine--fructose-6-phosphate transaminase (isomerizing) [Gammaproteobacteria bacterium]MCP5425692.1 glutamine--fructose-6-phosphate transaminase (isomerizing) [Gammaproteobacteria bacterium]MCP5459723.1 glutamine--fructose-6-phosphate transaminase (isomerizing) [Gammaproteobacteria bacterium]